MFRVKIHPLFFAAALIYVLLGKAELVLSCFFAVILHEVAHARVAAWRGYKMHEITLMPYGAMIKNRSHLKGKDAFYIAVAGPFFNLFCAIVIIALWWLIPALYTATLTLCIVNLSVGLFNLLPVFPLDGSRILLSFFKKPKKIYVVLKACGIALSVMLFGVCIASIFFQFNFSYGVMAAFLFYGALFGADKEEYMHLGSKTPFVKTLERGVEVKQIMLSGKAPLLKAVGMVRADTVIHFLITDDEMNTVAVLEESALQELSLQFDLKTPIETAISGTKCSE